MGFKRHTSYLMLLRVVIILAGTVTSIILARSLGPEDKGKLELAVIVFPMLVASMGSMGTRVSSVYFSSWKGGAANIHRITLTMSILLGVFYAGSLLLFRNTSFVRDTLLQGLTGNLIILSACLIPVQLLMSTGDGLLHGRFKFGTHVAVQIAGVLFRMSAVVVFIGILGYRLFGAVAIYSLSIVIPTVLTLYFVLKSKAPGPKVSTGQVMSYSLRAWWGGAAQRANMQLDSLVVNAFIDNASLGIYSIATLFSRPLLQIPGSVSQALFPRVAATNPKESAQDVALLNRNWLVLGTLISVSVGVVGTYLIGPVFGEAFAPAANALWAMLPGVLAFGVSSILAQFLAGTGRPQLSSTASVIALVANIPALLFLVPRFGIVGAGLAITTTHSVRAAVMAYFFQRTSGVPARDYLFPRREDASYYRRGLRALRRRLSGNA